VLGIPVFPRPCLEPGRMTNCKIEYEMGAGIREMSRGAAFCQWLFLFCEGRDELSRAKDKTAPILGPLVIALIWSRVWVGLHLAIVAAWTGTRTLLAIQYYSKYLVVLVVWCCWFVPECEPSGSKTLHL
jgi:hypothetical protein